MVFDFTSGQDLCTSSYFTNAIPVVRSPLPPRVDSFYINPYIADRAPDHQAGIPPCRLAQHHFRLRGHDKECFHTFCFLGTNLVHGWSCYRTAVLPCSFAKCVYWVRFKWPLSLFVFSILQEPPVELHTVQLAAANLLRVGECWLSLFREGRHA